VRILLVNWQDLTNPEAGGAEVHLHEIFGRLAAGGHDVHLVCSGYRGAPREAVLDGMKVHRVSTRYGFALAARREFRALAAALRPDVVVEDVNKVPLRLAGLWEGPFVLLVPHLFGATVFRELPWPVAAMVWLSERALPRSYRDCGVQAISASTRDDLVERGFRAGDVRVIYPGVDAVRLCPDSSVRRWATPLLLYVGRLKRYKRIDVAIRALALLRRELPAAELWVAGSGDDRTRLESVAGRAGVAGAVKFLGRVSEVRKLELYRQAWAVVLPSLKEGWGITNLEAAACGTPAVAADNSALRESVRHGETGYLVPTDSVTGFAEALGRICRDAAQLERLARAARAFAESFSWSRTAAETLSHLEAMVAGWPRRQEPL
jgi:glycosyltransferase involved in cell wall biosynthesis